MSITIPDRNPFKPYYKKWKRISGSETLPSPISVKNNNNNNILPNLPRISFIIPEKQLSSDGKRKGEKRELYPSFFTSLNYPNHNVQHVVGMYCL